MTLLLLVMNFNYASSLASQTQPSSDVTFDVTWGDLSTRFGGAQSSNGVLPILEFWFASHENIQRHEILPLDGIRASLTKVRNRKGSESGLPSRSPWGWRSHGSDGRSPLAELPSELSPAPTTIRCNFFHWKRKWAILFFLTSGLVWLAWVFAFTTSSSSWRTSIACFCEKRRISKTEKKYWQNVLRIFFVVCCLCVCFSPAAWPTSLAYFCQETIQLAEILLCYSSIVFVSSDNHLLFPSYTQHYFSLIVFALNYYESVFKTPPAHHWIRSALVSPPNNSRIPQLLLRRLCPLVVSLINPFPCGMIFTMQIITRRFSKSVFKLRPAHLWIRSALVSSPNNSYIPIHTA